MSAQTEQMRQNYEQREERCRIVLAAIKAAALAGKPCPSDYELGRLIGASGKVAANVIRLLKLKRLISSQSGGRKRIVTGDGWETAPVVEPVKIGRPVASSKVHRSIPCHCLTCGRPFLSFDRSRNRLCEAHRGGSDPLPDYAVVRL